MCVVSMVNWTECLTNLMAVRGVLQVFQLLDLQLYCNIAYHSCVIADNYNDILSKIMVYQPTRWCSSYQFSSCHISTPPSIMMYQTPLWYTSYRNGCYTSYHNGILATIMVHQLSQWYTSYHNGILATIMVYQLPQLCASVLTDAVCKACCAINEMLLIISKTSLQGCVQAFHNIHQMQKLIDFSIVLFRLLHKRLRLYQ